MWRTLMWKNPRSLELIEVGDMLTDKLFGFLEANTLLRALTLRNFPLTGLGGTESQARPHVACTCIDCNEHARSHLGSPNAH